LIKILNQCVAYEGLMMANLLT